MQYLDRYTWTDNVFAILFGKEFIPKCYLLTSIDYSICLRWIKGLNEALKFNQVQTYKFKLERYLQREYNKRKDALNNT